MIGTRPYTLFGFVSQRTYTGERFDVSLFGAEAKAALVERLKNVFRERTTIDEKFDVLETLESLSVDLGDIGFDETDADFLVEYYSRGMMGHAAEIEKHYRALAYAAKFKTNHASRPALSMACLYANELVENSHIDTAHTDSIDDRYRDYMDFLSRLPVTAETTSARIAGKLAFAKLGSKLAIDALIQNYKIGSNYEAIQPDKQKLEYWELKKKNRSGHLLSRFQMFFELELDRIVREDSKTGRLTPLATLTTSCHAVCLAAGDEAVRQMQPDEYLISLLEKKANNNDRHAMHCLAIRALTNYYPCLNIPYRPVIANRWCQRILETFTDPNPISANIAYRLFLHEKNEDERERLLKLAHSHGCTKSLNHLAELDMQRGEYDQALEKFQSILREQNHTDNLVRLSTCLSNNPSFLGLHAGLTSFSIDFALTQQEGVGCIPGIMHALIAAERPDLAAKWKLILRRMMEAHDYPLLAKVTKSILGAPRSEKRIKI